MRQVVTACLLTVLFSSTVLAADHAQTHCDDPAVWVDWHEKAAKQSVNLDFQSLHALWMGLCLKVKSGGLTEDEASSIFDRAHETLLKQWREEKTQPPVPTL